MTCEQPGMGSQRADRGLFLISDDRREANGRVGRFDDAMLSCLMDPPRT